MGVSKIKTKIVAIGDSLTAGFPFMPEYSWVQTAAEALGVTIVNAGVCGETTGEMLGRFRCEAAGNGTTHAIIMGGSNDIFLGLDAGEIGENIRGMIDLARQYGIEAVLGLPPPCTFSAEAAELAAYRFRLQNIATQAEVPVIDFYAAFCDEAGKVRSEYLPDGVHPSERGYQRMGVVAIEKLREILPILK